MSVGKWVWVCVCVYVWEQLGEVSPISLHNQEKKSALSIFAQLGFLTIYASVR